MKVYRDAVYQAHGRISWYRLTALFRKEFYIVARDPIIFVSAILFPLVEVILFATLFNINPHHIPTTVILGEQTAITRSLLEAFKNSDYYDIKSYTSSLADANSLLSSGKVNFILQIPPGFTRDVLTHRNPEVLLVADGSNPLAVAGATSAVSGIAAHALKHDLVGAKTNDSSKPPFKINLQQRYNPTVNAKYYTLPSLIGVLLGLIMMMLSAMALSKEKSEGTMEGLLSTPAIPIEVILTKMMPYFVFGFLQFILVLLIAYFIFKLPFNGSFFLMLFCSFFYISACIGVGTFFSLRVKNPETGIQLTSQFFALNVLFSGFFFPFVGMPLWAQFIGNLLPLTHFIKLSLGIILKGSSFLEIWPHLWPIMVFTIIIFTLILSTYKQTLD